jgi:hypothetical protein
VLPSLATFFPWKSGESFSVHDFGCAPGPVGFERRFEQAANAASVMVAKMTTHFETTVGLALPMGAHPRRREDAADSALALMARYP